MATTDLTASVASGYLTDVLYFNNGPMLWMVGHYSSPASGTAIIETGMYDVRVATIQDADMDTTYFSAGANGTYAVLASGLTTGDAGFFMIQGY